MFYHCKLSFPLMPCISVVSFLFFHIFPILSSSSFYITHFHLIIPWRHSVIFLWLNILFAHTISGSLSNLISILYMSLTVHRTPLTSHKLFVYISNVIQRKYTFWYCWHWLAQLFFSYQFYYCISKLYMFKKKRKKEKKGFYKAELDRKITLQKSYPTSFG